MTYTTLARRSSIIEMYSGSYYWLIHRRNLANKMGGGSTMGIGVKLEWGGGIGLNQY